MDISIKPFPTYLHLHYYEKEGGEGHSLPIISRLGGQNIVNFSFQVIIYSLLRQLKHIRWCKQREFSP